MKMRKIILICFLILCDLSFSQERKPVLAITSFYEEKLNENLDAIELIKKINYIFIERYNENLEMVLLDKGLDEMIVSGSISNIRTSIDPDKKDVLHTLFDCKLAAEDALVMIKMTKNFNNSTDVLMTEITIISKSLKTRFIGTLPGNEFIYLE